MARSLTLEGDDRPRKRDLVCLVTGMSIGATLGLLAAPLSAIGLVLTLGGALAGGIVGAASASHISPEEWDPRPNDRPYVGTKSPDDDIARE